MVNLKSSDSNSATRKTRAKPSVNSENPSKDRSKKPTERRLRSVSQDNKSKNSSKGKSPLTSSSRDKVETSEQTAAAKKTKKKVNETEIELITLSDNDGSGKENQTDTRIRQKNTNGSPTHVLCDDFSTLRVHGSPNSDKSTLKKKQTRNDQKRNTARRNLSLNKSKSESDLTNHRITDYFQVRKSHRKDPKTIVDEKQRDLENKVIRKVKDGLEIKVFEDKGRGIIATKKFYKGDFVIEYIGDLIDGATAKQREMKYAKNKKLGCYMYYFRHKDIQYCIDATKESKELGRLINHSRKGNLISKIVDVEDKPRLVFFAKVEISPGTELLYDYGDRSPEAMKYHPWLAL